MPENDPNPNYGAARAFFWIVMIALSLMIIIAVSLWGCQRWKQTKGHTEPETRILSVGDTHPA
jgi:hypothetical protein